MKNITEAHNNCDLESDESRNVSSNVVHVRFIYVLWLLACRSLQWCKIPGSWTVLFYQRGISDLAADLTEPLVKILLLGLYLNVIFPRVSRFLEFSMCFWMKRVPFLTFPRHENMKYIHTNFFPSPHVDLPPVTPTFN